MANSIPAPAILHWLWQSLTALLDATSVVVDTKLVLPNATTAWLDASAVRPDSSVWNHHANSIAGSNKLKKLKKVLSCPGNLNDVRISTNTTLITTIFCCSKNCLDAVDSRTDNQDPPHHSNPRSTSKQEPPKHQPTNMDQPQITINSPAIAHQSRHPQSWFRNHFPNRSHIPQTQESGLDVKRITSSSKPDPETDHPKPNTLDEDSGNGLESEDDQEDLSNETLGDLNLSALDDLKS
ncbi:hypothetical protein PCASD_11961 [Puccinia coronata f. sp. avenae]|uniref:Uncharacterized protein n=1 Tax=Puccinia coronata f. sp. avenae TaxID=200324 RepID=A0A2N5UWD1_9BASI|nr:hypothetical protein PCASD_11961 [Puccinia coronata f. sp. avenae]